MIFPKPSQIPFPSKVTSVLQICYNLWYTSIWICSVLFTLFAPAKLPETIWSYIKKES